MTNEIDSNNQNTIDIDSAQQDARLVWFTPEIMLLDSNTIETGGMNVPESVTGVLS